MSVFAPVAADASVDASTSAFVDARLDLQHALDALGVGLGRGHRHRDLAARLAAGVLERQRHRRDRRLRRARRESRSLASISSQLVSILARQLLHARLCSSCSSSMIACVSARSLAIGRDASPLVARLLVEIARAGCATASRASSRDVSSAAITRNSTTPMAMIGTTTITAKKRRNRPRKEGWSRVMG